MEDSFPLDSGRSCQDDSRTLLLLCSLFGAFLVAQMVKNLPAMQDSQVRSLGLEDPLEEEVTIHSTLLAWRIPWTEEPDRL